MTDDALLFVLLAAVACLWWARLWREADARPRPAQAEPEPKAAPPDRGRPVQPLNDATCTRLLLARCEALVEEAKREGGPELHA